MTIQNLNTIHCLTLNFKVSNMFKPVRFEVFLVESKSFVVSVIDRIIFDLKNLYTIKDAHIQEMLREDPHKCVGLAFTAAIFDKTYTIV